MLSRRDFLRSCLAVPALATLPEFVLNIFIDDFPNSVKVDGKGYVFLVYNLSKPFDLSTASYCNVSTEFKGSGMCSKSLTFNSDGSQIVIIATI